jgi:predicted AAA+ superfamily ATPase
MDRKLLHQLVLWKDRPNRKPLVIRGARQVGKTWIVKAFAEQFDQYIEINFDKNPEKARLLSAGDINKSLELLQVDSDTDIVSGKTLLFLDEIQAVPEVFPVLRYLYEERPDIHVVAAGSLLELLLADHDFSMPVGRVEYLYLGPMDFEEFIIALGQQRLAFFLNEYALGDVIPESIHKKLLDLVKLFWVIGGMPAAVSIYLHSNKLSDATREHSAVLQTYEDDFAKYRKRIYPQRLRKVFTKIPALIGHKLKYVNLDPNERARDLADTLQLLEMARVIYLVKHSAGNGIPLGAQVKERVFKPLFLDVGLVTTSLGLSLSDLELMDDLLLVNNGVLAEQFVGQHLLYGLPYYEKPQLYYWNREQKSSNAEVDYLTVCRNRVIPVEVKAGKTGTLKSMQVFVTEKKVPIALRFNANPPLCCRQETAIANKEKVCYQFVSLPLYLIKQVPRLLEQAMDMLPSKIT